MMKSSASPCVSPGARWDNADVDYYTEKPNHEQTN